MYKERLLQKLFSLHQFGIKLGLDSTYKLLDEIGNPHQNLRCYHVAGSNGKGSTSSFLASILMEMGYKVGLYTSPHFVRFNERIKINGKEIDDEYLIEFIRKLDKYIDDNKPTFFEITTALAFKYFSESKVDFAVIETGLGGRLDSTNVIDPIASVITSISLEHTEHLGNTIEEIAFEKAGIIKSNKKIFFGRLPVAAKKVIEKKAGELNSEIFPLEEFSNIDEDRISVKHKNISYNIYQTPLKGKHQLLNSALAVKTILETNEKVESKNIFSGIKKVIANTGIQGRYEIYSEKPRIIFDSAHNPEGIQTFVDEYEKEFHHYKNHTLIFSVMRDKNISKMLNLLHPYFDEIFYYELNFDRAAKFEEVEHVAVSQKIELKKINDPVSIIKNLIQKKGNDSLVVLGSMYLLGEIKSKLF